MKTNRAHGAETEQYILHSSQSWHQHHFCCIVCNTYVRGALFFLFFFHNAVMVIAAGSL